MKTNELRSLYLEFFKSKNHKVFGSDSLVPANDPSLLFTGAGMNQFKPYFLGLKKDVKRATSCQKCIRTADLERVGKTAYHHTFFEMLGNFSFGDYFKEEAIEYGWEFVTKALNFPKDKLWVSVYQEDDEAFNLWKNKIGIPESRIVRFDAEDNFWPSNAVKNGPNGPCGPCSEIYVGEIPGKGVEIWNLVFTQFDRQSDGSLLPLPQKNIDTGMGLERISAVMQGVNSNFDSDNFQIIRAQLKTLLKSGSQEYAHENAIMDHARAVAFCIADGALPSNEGRGYVIRKLIRYASDHMRKVGVVRQGSLYELVPSIIEVMKPAYPELLSKQKNIETIIQNEESAYLEIINSYLPQLEKELKNFKATEDLESIAFKYRDTYGMPYDNIVEAIENHGMKINPERFNEYMDEQKKRSRESSKITGEIFAKSDSYAFVDGLEETLFLGYEKTSADAKLLRIIHEGKITETLSAGQEGLLIFNQTPFYGESGGQAGDSGLISANGVEAEVNDTQWIEQCIAHKTLLKHGSLKIGQSFRLQIDEKRRLSIMRNHTATHLLHSALRKVLGEHVKQSGSLVAEDRLRFDFTHFSALGSEAISKIETMVNDEVCKKTTLSKKVMSKDEAMKVGAIAFFGDKYGDEVRVVTIGDFSKEFCGGTHLEDTAQIGSFKIVSEGSIQSGVRRIEAVTGDFAKHLLEGAHQELGALASDFKTTTQELPNALKELSLKISALESKLNAAAAKKMSAWSSEQLQKASPVGGVKLLMNKKPAANAELFQKAYDNIKTSPDAFIALWQCQNADKTTFMVCASSDVVKKGFNSGKLVKEISLIVEGNGGGRPDIAVGGGKNLQKIDEAMAFGKKNIETFLSSVKAA